MDLVSTFREKQMQMQDYQQDLQRASLNSNFGAFGSFNTPPATVTTGSAASGSSTLGSFGAAGTLGTFGTAAGSLGGLGSSGGLGIHPSSNGFGAGMVPPLGQGQRQQWSTTLPGYNGFRGQEL